MRAVVFAGTRSVIAQDVPDAVLEEPEDVVVRVTSSAICGTDLHMYDGRTGAEPGLVLGYEALGLVEQVGSAVETVRAGDRVVLPTHLYCGVCVNCARGLSAACLRVRPGGFGAAYGYAGMGPYRGGQAELLRVPFADANCVVVPGEPGDELEDDLVLLADAFVTGWHATELARMTPGVTVAVFGAGTIGLLSAYSALLRGAAVVYVVDAVPERLDKARGDRCRAGGLPAGRSGRADPRAAPGRRPPARPGADGRSPDRHRRRGVPGPRPRRPRPGEPDPGRPRPGPAGQPHRAPGHHRRLRREGPAPSPRWACRRSPDGAVGHLLQQGDHGRVRSHTRPSLHRAAARPGALGPGPAQRGRHPSRRARRRA